MILGLQVDTFQCNPADRNYRVYDTRKPNNKLLIS